MSTHKDFAESREHSSNIVRAWAQRKNIETRCDVNTQGGLFLNKQTGQPVAWVKPPFWRSNKDSRAVTVKDICTIYPEPNPRMDDVNTGSELELKAMDLNGNPVPVMYPNSAVTAQLEHHNNVVRERRVGNGVDLDFVGEDGLDFLADHQKKVGFSPELANFMIELNFDPGLDPIERNRRLLYALKKLSRVLEANRMLIQPDSMVGQRPLTQEDVNTHPYVRRIALDWMRWERVRHFVGTSLQTHVEMLDLESALEATNYYQFLTPILYALTLAGPFVDGRLDVDQQALYADIPDLSLNCIKAQTYAQMSRGISYSHRYVSRFFGSPSGGVMLEPLPTTTTAYWTKVEKLLESGEVPTVGRAGGHHTDFRVRTDLPPHGTIEIACMDTTGAHVQKMVAIQELTKTIGWKLQLYAKHGKMPELQQKYPILFGQLPSCESYLVVHENSIRVAKNGPLTSLMGMDGKINTVEKLWAQMVAFVQEPMEIDHPTNPIQYTGLPPFIIDELGKAFVDPATMYRSYADEQGFTSVTGFYETGYGTLSQWMIQRAQELMAQGMNEQDAIRNCSLNLGLAYRDHLANLTPGDIETMYDKTNTTIATNVAV